MSPDEVEVGEGDRVRLRITTSGVPTEVHLHGYDLQRDVAPGGPAPLSFDADLTGRFEIGDHEAGKRWACYSCSLAREGTMRRSAFFPPLRCPPS